jgi:hypothetical protein
VIEKLRALHRLKAELEEKLELLRQQAERRPDSVAARMHDRVVAECEGVRREIVQLTAAFLEAQRPQGSA